MADVPIHVLANDSVSGENGGITSEDSISNQDAEPPLIDPQAYVGRLGKKLQVGDTRSGSSNVLGASLPRKDQFDKGSLLPKFGEWDVTDPASGVGFTAIFEKVVVEKKAGRAAFFSTKTAASLIPMKFRGSSQRSADGSLIRNWCCCCCCFRQNG